MSTEQHNKILVLEVRLQHAVDRIEDMLKGDDAQAFKEAEKWLPYIRGDDNGFSPHEHYTKIINRLDSKIDELQLQLANCKITSREQALLIIELKERAKDVRYI